MYQRTYILLGNRTSNRQNWYRIHFRNSNTLARYRNPCTRLDPQCRKFHHFEEMNLPPLQPRDHRIKGPFIQSVSVSAAMTLAILFSLKTIVAPEWVCNPFSSNSTGFNENRIASVIAALTLTLGVNRCMRHSMGYLAPGSWYWVLPNARNGNR